MTEFLIANMAPIIFVSLIFFLLLGFHVLKGLTWRCWLFCHAFIWPRTSRMSPSRNSSTFLRYSSPVGIQGSSLRISSVQPASGRQLGRPSDKSHGGCPEVMH